MSEDKPDIHFYADLATIISLLIIMGIFVWEQFKINQLEKQNTRVLLESLRIEINSNVGFIEDFEKIKERYKSSNEFTQSSFSTIVLEEIVSQGKIGNETDKIMMRSLSNNMTITNRVMGRFQNLFFYNTEEQYNAWHKLKNETVDKVSFNNQIIKVDLLKLNETIKYFLENIN
ncbi:hypothetical protein A3K63_03045 [Candidatus Micrarchaeota archaeon RBG_16_49_10]|nr:MAG: hypothetical protein A3K63_03045 [Candidatus Micrarchaeota archaeon RBG_16_49_10]